MNLLLSPHNDDECLFAAYTLMREKPLVIIVTDSDAHLAEGITAYDRREESRRACELLGVPVVFLGLKDGALEQQKADLKRRLEPFASQPAGLNRLPPNRGHASTPQQFREDTRITMQSGRSSRRCFPP
jgi:LmbE family N-acetylglucosaminyl deacetylase